MNERSVFEALKRRFLALLLSLVRWFAKDPDDFSLRVREIKKGTRLTRRQEALEELARDGSLVLEGSDSEGHFFFVDVRFEGDRASVFVALHFDGESFVAEERSTRIQKVGSAVRVGFLLLECREPLRRWRIQIRGTLKSRTTQTERFVKLSGWWAGNWVPCHCFADLDPVLSAEGFVRSSPFEAAEVYTRTLTSEDFVHFGEFRCFFEEREFYLRGARIRRFPTEEDVRRSHLFSAYFESGDRLFFHRSEHSERDFALSGGHFFAADLSTHRLRSFEDDEGDIIYSTRLLGTNVLRNSKRDRLLFSYRRGNGTKVTVERISLEHEAKNSRGYAVVIKENGPEGKEWSVTNDAEELLERSTVGGEARRRTVVSLDAVECEDPSFTGGKGSNLAKLTRIQRSFVVPKGCAVTVTAFSRHLESNPRLKKLIGALADKHSGDSQDDLLQRISDEFDGTGIEEALRRELCLQLRSLFGAFESLPLAVRSSAVGEDGAELSSAGQLESFLDVEGTEQIARSVVECWKSNFRKEAVAYRRQYGQALAPPMAVVVQEMVSDGVAGVLFTNHPVSGDPEKMVLNAVKGVGEDLVAGHVTPTEVTLDKKLNLIATDQGDTVTEAQVKAIGEVGLFLEKRFGNPQDIEFVIKGDRIFVVQSRDITNLDLETRWELLHEFDSPLLSDQELISRANVGEVLPNAMTPLSITASGELYELGMRTSMAVVDGEDRIFSPTAAATAMYRQKAFINLTDMFLKGWKSVEKNPIFEMNLAGTRILTEEMFRTGRERYSNVSELRPLRQLVMGLKVMLFDSYRRLEDAKTRVPETPLADEKMGVKELLELVETQREILIQTIADHTVESVFSSFTYHFVASLLRGSSEGELSPETISDIATVYSASKKGVISADVPSSLENIARQIQKENLRDEFTALRDDSEALGWLKEQRGSRTAELVEEFLETHGHRGFNELDIGGLSWRRNSTQLVQTLKAMLSNDDLLQKEEISEPGGPIVDRLNCQASGIKRKLLAFFIREAHRGVDFREAAKDLLVKATDNLRETLLLVGQKLHEEKWIPRPRLILFFTLRELSEFVENRSARLIARAHRREELLPEQDAQEYSLMTIGRPSPKEKKLDYAVGKKLSGTPICLGVVTGKARVAKTLEEARDTQSGEILITKYTDIAWSPFFPLVRGLVTEIGGLLSHGSVVAREYGLPSIIAVEGATDFFRTGDDVLLDSSRGFISRISEEEE